MRLEEPACFQEQTPNKSQRDVVNLLDKWETPTMKHGETRKPIRLKTGGLTSRELQNAIQWLLGSVILDIQANTSWD